MRKHFGKRAGFGVKRNVAVSGTGLPYSCVCVCIHRLLLFCCTHIHTHTPLSPTTITDLFPITSRTPWVWPSLTLPQDWLWRSRAKVACLSSVPFLSLDPVPHISSFSNHHLFSLGPLVDCVSVWPAPVPSSPCIQAGSLWAWLPPPFPNPTFPEIREKGKENKLCFCLGLLEDHGAGLVSPSSCCFCSREMLSV